MSSDPESAKKLKSRRTTLNDEPEVAIMKSKDDLMAPPRTAPKRKKSRKNIGNKSAESRRSDEPIKRLEDDDTSEKNVKNMEDGSENPGEVGTKSNQGKNAKTDKIVKNVDKVSKKSVNNTKKANEVNKTSSNVNHVPEGDNSDNDAENIVDDRGKCNNVVVGSEVESRKGKVKNDIAGGRNKPLSSGKAKTGKDKNGTQIAGGDTKMNNDGKISGKKAVKRPNNTENSGNPKKPKCISGKKDQPDLNIAQTEKNIVKNALTKSAEKDIASVKNKKDAAAKKDSNTLKKVVQKEGHNKVEHGGFKTKDNNKNNENTKLVKKVVKKNVASTGTKSSEKVNSVATSKNSLEVGIKKVNSATVAKKSNTDQNNEKKKVLNKVFSNKTNTPTDKKTAKVSTKKPDNKNTQKSQSIDKNIDKGKTLIKPQTIPKVARVNAEKNVASTNKTTLKGNIAKNPLQTSNKLKPGNTKDNNMKPGDIEKENIQNKKTSKIPQKNPGLSALKNNPLRMSPRKYILYNLLYAPLLARHRALLTMTWL